MTKRVKAWRCLDLHTVGSLILVLCRLSMFLLCLNVCLYLVCPSALISPSVNLKVRFKSRRSYTGLHDSLTVITKGQQALKTRRNPGRRVPKVYIPCKMSWHCPPGHLVNLKQYREE